MSKIVEAYPVWEFECPECGELNQLSDGDFRNDRVYDGNGDWYSAECADTVCEHCNAEFTVTHD
jgi:predicted nucleic acid-binding Zn ribbon protein